MRHMLLLSAFVAAVAPAAGRMSPPARPAGAARSCIPIAAIRDTLVRSDEMIDFVMRDRSVYRVTLPRACPGLGAERRFAYATSLSRLCAQDIITVLTAVPIQRGASCGLAPFQPVALERR